VTAYFGLSDVNGHHGGVAKLDGYYYYIYLRSLQMDGDLELANDYRAWGNPFEFGETETGHARNVFGIGPAILWAPFFLATHAVALLGVKLGYPLSLDGMSRFHQVGTFLGTVFYGWLAVVFCYMLVRRVMGQQGALLATLGAALAGPLPCYVVAWASFSHAQATMATSLMFLLWVRWRDDWTLPRWIMFGLSAGLVVLVRPAAFPFMVLPLIEGARFLWPAARRRSLRAVLRRAAALAAGALAAVLLFTPQMLAWRHLFGKLIVTPQGDDFMWWSASAWHATLFSPRNGLLPSAPLMALALVGLLLVIRRRPAIGGAALATFVILALVNGAVSDWWGWAFSARRYTAALPIFALGLAAVVCAVRQLMVRNPVRAAAVVTGALILLAVLFNLQWMHMFDHRNLTWQNVRSTEGLYMTVAHGMTRRMYETVGNPLSLPASAAFSIRHGGDLETYDRIEGHYFLGEATRGSNPSADPYRHATLDFGDLRYRHNLSESFGTPKELDGKPYAPLREPRGHLFVPINRRGPLQMMVVARARHPGTEVKVAFNGHPIGQRALPVDRWSRIILTAPAAHVKRGINRVDLDHRLPAGWNATGARCIGVTGVCVPVDIAAVSGGTESGNFAELWVGGRKVSENIRGFNVAVVDPASGTLLGSRGFDTWAYPAAFPELARYLRIFPRGSVVALATRDRPTRHFHLGGAPVLALIGAQTALAQPQHMTAGYVALGVIGAPEGSAMEQVRTEGHARVHVGRPPPPWRELARYRAIHFR
jgi:hypothetical protein